MKRSIFTILIVIPRSPFPARLYRVGTLPVRDCIAWGKKTIYKI